MPLYLRSRLCYNVASISVCLSVTYVLWLNGAFYSKSYYWQHTENRIWEIDWYQNKWPWPLFIGHLRSCQSLRHIRHWISRKPLEIARGLVLEDHRYENAYGESNGHVTDDVKWPERSNSLRAQYLEKSWI